MKEILSLIACGALLVGTSGHAWSAESVTDTTTAVEVAPPATPQPLSFNPSSWELGEGWSLSNRSLSRENNGTSSDAIYQPQIPSHFAIAFTLTPRGIGDTDGKMIAITDGAENNLSVAIGDDHSFGIYDRVLRRWVVTSDALNVQIGVELNFVVRYSATGLTASVTPAGGEAVIITLDRELSPPYHISFQCQRTGALLTNLRYGR